MFLTREQLRAMTGYVQPRRQIRWLQKNGIPHYVRGDGYPVVLASALEHHDGAPHSHEPNFAAIGRSH